MIDVVGECFVYKMFSYVEKIGGNMLNIINANGTIYGGNLHFKKL